MKKRILCFGDSNTWGAEPGSGPCSRYPAEVRWTGILQKKLGDGYQIIEEGYNGRTTVFEDPVENLLSGIAYFGPCVASQSPLDLIVLMLGTNDMKKRFGVGPQSSVQGLYRYLQVLKITRMAGEIPQILLIAPPRIEKDYQKDACFLEMFGDDAHERSLMFSSVYRAFAEENNLLFLDASENAKISSVDGIHLLPEGHAALADAIFETINKWFASRE